MELAQWVLSIYFPIVSHRPFLSKIDFRIILHFNFIYFFITLSKIHKLEPLERYSKCVPRATTYKSGVREYNLCRRQEEGRKTPVGRFPERSKLISPCVSFLCWGLLWFWFQFSRTLKNKLPLSMRLLLMDKHLQELPLSCLPGYWGFPHSPSSSPLVRQNQCSCTA